MRKKLKKGETKRGIGPAGGAPVSEKTGKVFTGHKGTKRSVGPAGAPVSKKTGKVFGEVTNRFWKEVGDWSFPKVKKDN
jgi:hypothetical protein